MINPTHLAKEKGIEGNHYYEQGEFAKAVICFQEAVALDALYAEIHFNCGLAYQALNQFSQALHAYEQALIANPHYADAYINRGNILRDLNRFEDAKQSYLSALGINSESVQALNNLGVVCYELREIPEAIDSFLKAIQIDSDHTNAHWGLSLCYLINGDYEKGWQNFEWRLKDSFFVQQTLPHEYEEYLWQKDDSLKDQTILLMAEQGFGDTIQFCRFAKHLQILGARVVLQVPFALVDLLNGIEGVDLVISASESAQEIDWVLPLMSIPERLGLQENDFAMDQPYIKADPLKISQLDPELFSTGKIKVGLVWQGGIREYLASSWATHYRRNIPLSQIITLLHPSIDFYSLQKGQVAENELKLFKESHPGININEFVLTNFSDTAAVISQLDLVITVDTAVAHLVGAMGKPVWVLHRHDACWRWLLNRQDTTWYPMMRHYRQKISGDWSEVISRVQRDLETFISAHK